MSIVQKRHYWGHKPYNTKTGRFQGETTMHSDGRTTDWRGRELPKYTGPTKTGDFK